MKYLTPALLALTVWLSLWLGLWWAYETDAPQPVMWIETPSNLTRV